MLGTMRTSFVAALSLFLVGGVLAQDRLTPELLWKLDRVSDPQVSPDGRAVLYHVRSYSLAENRGATHLYWRDLKDGRERRLTTAGSNWNARWLPAGDAIVFLSSRSGAAQAWRLELAGGDPVQLTAVAGGIDNLLVSPDAKWLAFTARVKLDPDIHDLHPDLPHADARVYDSLMVRHWDQWRDGTYNHLHVQAIDGGEPRDLMAGLRIETPLPPFGGVEQITWTPDSAALIYTARMRQGEAETTNSDLWLAPLDAGPHRNLTVTNPGYDTTPAFSPDGRRLAWLSMARDGYESDVNRLMVSTWPQLEPRRVDEWDGTVAEFTWSKDSKTLVFGADHRGTTQLFEVGIGGGVPAPRTAGRWQFSHPVVLADDQVLALRQNTERPFELVRVERGTQPSAGVPITDVNGEHFAKLALPIVEERWFEATDGASIHAWVVKPPDFDPSKRWPMLLYCQGGPQSQVGQWFSYRWNFHLMAARGYVVLAVNRRGLPGFGAAWNEQISGDWGGQCMQDLLSATDAMQAEPWIDRKRTAAIGASFGGYTIYWLMGHDPERRFCAMLAHCGVFNLESMALSTEELFFVNWDLGAGYWRDESIRRRYEAFSPHRFVQEWRTPLMVIHGQQDFRVPLEQGLGAFTAAQLQGCPSRFVYFPEESHWVLGAQNGVLWHRLFFDWLDRWCAK
jgi:dipeptidyl aminopeptidase/acylaminoacyl peptidase